jgi:hypothetical protein
MVIFLQKFATFWVRDPCYARKGWKVRFFFKDRAFLILGGKVVAGLKWPFCKNRPLLVDFKRQTRAQKTRKHFSLPRPIVPTRSIWQFWASETLQKRSSNASVMLQKCSTSGLHVLLDVFIHCGRFHGHWARRFGAPLACVWVCLAAAVCDR